MDNCRMYIMRMMVVLLIILVININVISIVDAQMLPPCAGDKMLPCTDYLNSTHPPDICCNPIKEIFEATHDYTCFCQISTPGLLESFGVKLALAVKVVNSCGVKFDPTSCKASAPGLSPSLMQPPATRGSDGGGAGMITFTGHYFILFIWACMLFH
ncbi:putative bifunctional inhibitor/plant lipid transfer protein/seed storage helical [Medicago truncatula]|uniref:Lipid transfer protein n=1 Tax=Medicago truncatula TaxID=3880 RepID=A0A072UEE6_MEDTR|nr:non-specific lipid transfer protein GPI-anchored 8 [Medicago truncatula]KEH27458.1 Lipid transfer protein [Medicago truncatula]RHN53715.1 putative bifunctional inhibitor/plant lipid transfer protein/seed storage helical [Medicago truncatula]